MEGTRPIKGHYLPAIKPGTVTMNPRFHVIESVLKKGFPFSRRLSSHASCVNAITFSSVGGRFMASGGDDLRVKIWDFHQDDLKLPQPCDLAGPRGNIFTLAFSAKNRYLYSGGTCETVYQYDVSSMDSLAVSQTAERAYLGQMGSIRGISCHPFNEDIFVCGSEDGTVRRYDARSPSTRSSQDALQLTSEVTGVQFHPKVDHLFVTSDNRGNVCLRDGRMAFGTFIQRNALGVVRTYNTKLTRRSRNHISNPEASSLVFDRDGEKLAVTMLHYLPTIYALSDPNPVAVCNAKKLPNGNPVPEKGKTYSNSCTMKHGSFGGPGMDADEFYGAGSDDFRGYIWKIPPLSQLAEQRKEISATDWWASNDNSSFVAFTEGFSRTKYIPVELSTPLCRLTGHRSIVNTVVFHPRFLHVVTAGIEKDIILHSPTPGSPCTQNLERTPIEVRSIPENNEDDRQIYCRAVASFLPLSQRDEEEEDSTISMFDYILREEGQTDVFNVRKWRPEPGSSDEEEIESDSSDDDRDVYEI